MKTLLLLTVLFSGLCPLLLQAQTTYEELQAIVPAKVLDITAEKSALIAGTDVVADVQTVKAIVLDGDKKDQVVTFENDLIKLEVGDKVYISHIKDINGREFYLLKDVDRGSGLIWLALIFVFLLVVFAGWQGIRAVSSLFLSILGIVFVLLPALLAGYDPILMSLLIAGVILALALFGTHGVTALSTIAFGGTVLAVVITSGLAWFFVHYMHLTGYGSDAAVHLTFATSGKLDLVGLLIGSIIIGVLGVLDDISITQASVVQELKAANNDLTWSELYKRALKVGRDHVGSLVNTLALAYVAAALPLVLLFSTSQSPLYFTLNQEVIAAELARIMIGSIGLILAVPFTTALAAWWFSDRVVLPGSVTHHHH